MSMTSSAVDAPIQTNAADPEQVEAAGDAEYLAALQDYRDAGDEIVDAVHRRRAFDRLSVLFKFAPVTESRLELGRFLGRHDAAVRLLARYRQHPDLCTQMLMEGFTRIANDDKANRAKTKKKKSDQ